MGGGGGWGDRDGWHHCSVSDDVTVCQPSVEGVRAHARLDAVRKLVCVSVLSTGVQAPLVRLRVVVFLGWCACCGAPSAYRVCSSVCGVATRVCCVAAMIYSVYNVAGCVELT